MQEAVEGQKAGVACVCGSPLTRLWEKPAGWTGGGEAGWNPRIGCAVANSNHMQDHTRFVADVLKRTQQLFQTWTVWRPLQVLR